MIAFLTWVGTPLLNHQIWRFLRILFPSWRFFESLTPIPKVYYRVKEDSPNYGQWTPLIKPEVKRRWFNLFHNPSENLYLTYQVQIEQLLNDLSVLSEQDQTPPEKLVTYRIVKAYIESQILRLSPHPIQSYQFKIGVLEFTPANAEAPQWSEIIISPELSFECQTPAR